MPGQFYGINQGVQSHYLHNRNCYQYLKKLRIPRSMFEQFPDSLQKKIRNLRANKSYYPNAAYADTYSQLFKFVEDNIEDLYDNPRLIWNTYIQKGGQKGDFQDKIDALDNFILSLYDNDNKILETTFEAIKSITLAKTPSSDELEKAIATLVEDSDDSVNKQAESPAQAGSPVARFTSMVSPEFKPQHTTSLSTVRYYRYNASRMMKELRFGTQGQRHHGVARVSPLFERFLSIQAERAVNKSQITHIYFNNLGLDRTDFEGKQERNLSLALHALEASHPNVAVITLPSDKGFMHKDCYKKTKKELNAEDVYDEFLTIALEDPNAKTKVKDFKISPAIRQLLFTDKLGNYSFDKEKKILGRLLANSFAALGIDRSDVISQAQRQAVWFHFNKFALTNFIIDTLDPETINFSCKDAIDRGGVSSAYYNLLKSFEKDSLFPMTREEFDRGLHAAPTMVKGRGMNHHLKVIWNIIDAYVNENYWQLQKDPAKSWLIEWRDYNCPHARVGAVLALRLEQSIEELESSSFSSSKKPSVQTGLKILHEIKEQSKSEVSGKRLLLEAAILTPKMALGASREEVEHYQRLRAQLYFNPVFMILGGLMKTLIGLVIFASSFGHMTSIYKSGVATLKAGCAFPVRQALRSDMKQQIEDSKDELLEQEELERYRIF